MAYTINLTNGTIFATIADGTINTTSSMTLVGKNYAGYGQFLDDNFIHLLENGANTTAPAAPLTGQLWWDTTNTLLKVYNGSTFKTISAATASATAPVSNVTGDLWYDTTNQQVKVYTGAAFLVVGPAYTSASGTAGAIPETINDTTASPHYVTSIYVNSLRVAIYSTDATFSAAAPASTLFPTIYKGMTMSNATGTDISGNLVSTGNIVIAAGGSTTATFTGTGISAVGNITGGNLSVGTGISAVGNITGGNLSVGTGTITGGNILNSNANAVGNIGSSSNYFNQVFATATTALYADVAERFAADELLEPGTVVELGGTAEITRSREELSENVFGVISTRAAYLMNGGAGENDTHPPVAMTGRVPVKVVGIIHKGDRLVSAGLGIARAAQPGEATSFNVIGRSLVDKPTPESGTIEAIVTIKN